jgi:hypothetical protein
MTRPEGEVKLEFNISPKEKGVHLKIFPPEIELLGTINLTDETIKKITPLLIEFIEKFYKFTPDSSHSLDFKINELKRILNKDNILPKPVNGCVNFIMHPHFVYLRIQEYLETLEELSEEYFPLLTDLKSKGHYERYLENIQYGKDWLNKN